MYTNTDLKYNHELDLKKRKSKNLLKNTQSTQQVTLTRNIETLDPNLNYILHPFIPDYQNNPLTFLGA